MTLKLSRSSNIKQIIISVVAALCVLSSCRTVHLDVTVQEEPFEPSEAVRSPEEEEEWNTRELEEIAIEEELREVDVERTVVYIRCAKELSNFTRNS